MHLDNRPLYFTKGSRRTAAYYTVQVRELIADGWTLEQSSAKPSVQVIESVTEQAADELDSHVEIADAEESEKDLNEMTKAELIAYAEANGIEFKQYATKSEILDACLVAQNG